MKNAHFFTLAELIAVLAIGLLVVALVVGRVGKLPAFVSLKSKVDNVRVLLVDASSMALIQGKKITVKYDSDSKRFSMAQGVESENKSRHSSCGLPEAITVQFPDIDTDSPEFHFYPDGSGSGPTVVFSMKGHSLKMTISPLSGAVMLEDEDED